MPIFKYKTCTSLLTRTFHYDFYLFNMFETSANIVFKIWRRHQTRGGTMFGNKLQIINYNKTT